MEYHKYIYLLYMILMAGVYKQWTGLLEWWNSGMVDWVILFLLSLFIILYLLPSLW